MCDFSDVYIVVKGDITVTESNNAERNKSFAFKNNAPFINSISKINDVQIDNAEALRVVMPMYNVYEYSKNQRKTSVVCGIITGTSQIIFFLLILNLLNTRQVLQEIHTILLLVMLIMIKPKSLKIKLKLLFH